MVLFCFFFSYDELEFPVFKIVLSTFCGLTEHRWEESPSSLLPPQIFVHIDPPEPSFLTAEHSCLSSLSPHSSFFSPFSPDLHHLMLTAATVVEVKSLWSISAAESVADLQDSSSPPQYVHCGCCWLGVFIPFCITTAASEAHPSSRNFACGSTTSSVGIICTQVFCCGAVLYILHCAVTSFALSSFTHGICISGSDILQLFSSTLFCVTLLCKSEHEWRYPQIPNWYLGWKWLRCSPQTEKSGKLAECANTDIWVTFTWLESCLSLSSVQLSSSPALTQLSEVHLSACRV